MKNEKQDERIVEDELSAYEKLRQQVSKSFGELNDKINAESIGNAVEKAKADLKKAGGYSKDVISRTGEALKKDIASSISQIKPKATADMEETRKDFNKIHDKGGALWREISSEAERIKELSLDKGGAFLLNVTRGLGEWAGSLSDKLGSSLTYKTGEVTRWDIHLHILQDRDQPEETGTFTTMPEMFQNRVPARLKSNRRNGLPPLSWAVA